MKTIVVNRVDTLFQAVKYFEDIINIATNKTLKIDFRESPFIRNHYLAVIGMGLEVVKNRNISIKILKPKNHKVLYSMKRINFLSAFCDEIDEHDVYKTMVKYTNIPLYNYDLPLQHFYEYFMEQFKGKVGNLSPKLLNKILQKIFELFSNVFRHSNSALGLFCSGQFYPDRNKFNFTIADNGVTIKTNVNKFLVKKFIENRSLPDKLSGKKYKLLDAVESIKWALLDENSTTGEGGLGLTLLMDLITISGGSVEIISGNGYYGINNAEETVNKLPETFEGTVISIELNTDSERYYFLKEEKSDGNS